MNANTGADSLFLSYYQINHFACMFAPDTFPRTQKHPEVIVGVHLGLPGGVRVEMLVQNQVVLGAADRSGLRISVFTTSNGRTSRHVNKGRRVRVAGD